MNMPTTRWDVLDVPLTLKLRAKFARVLTRPLRLKLDDGS